MVARCATCILDPTTRLKYLTSDTAFNHVQAASEVMELIDSSISASLSAAELKVYNWLAEHMDIFVG